MSSLDGGSDYGRAYSHSHSPTQSRASTAGPHIPTILPHTARPADSKSRSPSSSGTPKTRSGQVLVACAACQKRKSKCTGERPRCSLCCLKKTECVYETRFGEARSTQLKRRVAELSQENQHLKNAINTLRSASHYQATDLLLRIRTASELDDALRMINDSALLLSVRRESTSGSSSSESNGSSTTNTSVGSLVGTPPTSLSLSQSRSMSSERSFDRDTRDKTSIMKIGNLVTADDPMDVR